MEHRTAHSTILPDEKVFNQRTEKGLTYGEWATRNSTPEMGPVELPDKVHIVFPTGAVVNKQHGQWYNPAEEGSIVREGWRRQHAEAWLKKNVEEFERIKWQAQENPLGADWVPELARLQAAVKHAKQNLAECHEALEAACGRGAEWRRQQKEQEVEIERGRQARKAREGAVLNAIHDIRLDDDIPLSRDEE